MGRSLCGVYVCMPVLMYVCVSTKVPLIHFVSVMRTRMMTRIVILINDQVEDGDGDEEEEEEEDDNEDDENDDELMRFDVQ